MARLSGLQRDVLRLYRLCIRSVNKKPVETKGQWMMFVKREFEKNKHLSKRQFSLIEHLLRVGNKRLEMYLNPQIKNIHSI